MNLPEYKGPVKVEDKIKKMFKSAFLKRMKKDEVKLGDEVYQIIEDTYQKASSTSDTKEAEKLYKEIIRKYPSSNRAGCSAVMLVISNPDDKLYKRCYTDFKDDIFGDGVQVAPYSKFLHANYLFSRGKEEEAAGLHNDVLKNYPKAIAHNGVYLRYMIYQLYKDPEKYRKEFKTHFDKLTR